MTTELTREQKAHMMGHIIGKYFIDDNIGDGINPFTSPKALELIGQLVDEIGKAEADPQYNDIDWVMELIWGEIGNRISMIVAAQMKEDLMKIWNGPARAVEYLLGSHAHEDLFDDGGDGPISRAVREIATVYFGMTGSRFSDILEAEKKAWAEQKDHDEQE